MATAITTYSPLKLEETKLTEYAGELSKDVKISEDRKKIITDQVQDKIFNATRMVKNEVMAKLEPAKYFQLNKNTKLGMYKDLTTTLAGFIKQLHDAGLTEQEIKTTTDTYISGRLELIEKIVDSMYPLTKMAEPDMKYQLASGTMTIEKKGQ